jgi:multidrug transporter EmrE-like cation transporter
LGYLFIALMLAFTLYGQLAIKWQVTRAGPVPSDAVGMVQYVVSLLLSPWVLTGLAAAFLASICWMLALTRMELSRAYPFTALGLVLIIAASATLFAEPITFGKLAGAGMIVAGILVVALFN